MASWETLPDPVDLSAEIFGEPYFYTFCAEKYGFFLRVLKYLKILIHVRTGTVFAVIIIKAVTARMPSSVMKTLVLCLIFNMVPGLRP